QQPQVNYISSSSSRRRSALLPSSAQSVSTRVDEARKCQAAVDLMVGRKQRERAAREAAIEERTAFLLNNYGRLKRIAECNTRSSACLRRLHRQLRRSVRRHRPPPRRLHRRRRRLSRRSKTRRRAGPTPLKASREARAAAAAECGPTGVYGGRRAGRSGDGETAVSEETAAARLSQFGQFVVPADQGSLQRRPRFLPDRRQRRASARALASSKQRGRRAAAHRPRAIALNASETTWPMSCRSRLGDIRHAAAAIRRRAGWHPDVLHVTGCSADGQQQPAGRTACRDSSGCQLPPRGGGGPSSGGLRLACLRTSSNLLPCSNRPTSGIVAQIEHSAVFCEFVQQRLGPGRALLAEQVH
uniref:DUF630 domain-containing protein n=1 Tax=Macrostomum lignano TaxID=282301 RepID=A0A1I8FPU2_9PLAT